MKGDSHVYVRMSQRQCISRYYFFFQAEDGIRDYKVTGVQTCALPIYGDVGVIDIHSCIVNEVSPCGNAHTVVMCPERSEERRVGKSVDLGGRRIIKKKKKKIDMCASCD